MEQKYKVGDKVRIVSIVPKHHPTTLCWNPAMNTYLGKIMTIKSFDGYKYRLKEARWYWSEDWFEDVKETELKESEEKQMKLTGFKEAVKIIINHTPFYYALYGSANVKAGDKVLVTGTASGRIHTVEDVVSAEEALLEVGQPLCTEVICKVDTSAYDARVKQREQKAKLRKLMEATVAQMDEVDKFRVYADHNPEMAKLLAQYNEINV